MGEENDHVTAFRLRRAQTNRRAQRRGIGGSRAENAEGMRATSFDKTQGDKRVRHTRGARGEKKQKMTEQKGEGDEGGEDSEGVREGDRRRGKRDKEGKKN